MLKGSLHRLFEPARKRERLGLSEKQITDEEIEQLGLIGSPVLSRTSETQSASVTVTPSAPVDSFTR